VKANYNRKLNIRERAVSFRVKNENTDTVYRMDILQSNLFGNELNVKDTTYLDFENEEQIDKLINGLQNLKCFINKTDEGDVDESTTESR
jgi:hypothetical protein